jgi:lipoprotein-anchoring transpeptidase ErfK/SrfK
MRKFLILILAIFIASTIVAENRIVVSKKEMTLTVYNDSDSILLKTKISCGKNFGNKTRRGDNKTPEGTFKINMIQPSSQWTWDFKDGKGKIKGAYGPYFLRLKTPITTMIGIHGTCYPELIGTRTSSGCVRIHNDEMLKLVKLVKVGTKVTIEKDFE